MWEPQGIDIQSGFFSKHTHTNTTHSNSTKVQLNGGRVFLAELAYQVTTCAPILAVIQVFI
jgi:hypothetical protein